MPSGRCNHILETGFRCERAFKRNSNLDKETKCLEHRRKRSARNRYVAQADLANRKENLRQYVESLQNEVIPNIQYELAVIMGRTENISNEPNEEITTKIAQLEIAINDLSELVALDDVKFNNRLVKHNAHMDTFMDRMSKKVETTKSEVRRTINKLNGEFDFALGNSTISNKIVERMGKANLELHQRNVQLESRIATLEEQHQRLLQRVNGYMRRLTVKELMELENSQ
tara:strand:- start:10819 stop:11505 length:687 start_codon:yes stop_codon:yes gene_type:complete